MESEPIKDAAEEELPVPEPKTDEELMNEEPELDTMDPDKSPRRYQKMVEENNRLIGDLANEIMDKYVMNSAIPYAFIEILPQVLTGRIKIIKGRSKAFEEINKLGNKAHLTPVKDMDLYEYTATSVVEDEDLGIE